MHFPQNAGIILELFTSVLCVYAKSLQLCPTLCNPMDCSPPGSRQEYWSGLPCFPPGDLPNTGTEPTSLDSPALAGGFFISSTTLSSVMPTERGGLCSTTYQSPWGGNSSYRTHGGLGWPSPEPWRISAGTGWALSPRVANEGQHCLLRSSFVNKGSGSKENVLAYIITS